MNASAGAQSGLVSPSVATVVLAPCALHMHSPKHCFIFLSKEMLGPVPWPEPSSCIQSNYRGAGLQAVANCLVGPVCQYRVRSSFLPLLMQAPCRCPAEMPLLALLLPSVPLHPTLPWMDITHSTSYRSKRPINATLFVDTGICSARCKSGGLVRAEEMDLQRFPRIPGRVLLTGAARVEPQGRRAQRSPAPPPPALSRIVKL